MKTSVDLESMLRDIDHKSYPAYKSLRGMYNFGAYALSIDRVQGDPFAAPSRLTIHITDKSSGFSSELWNSSDKKTAFCDFLLRRFAAAVQKYSFQARGSGKSGALFATHPGQEVLNRTACTIDKSGHTILMRFEAGFPANGRTINSRELRKILFEYLPAVVENSLYSRNTDKKALLAAIHLYEDQQALRALLPVHGLTAFVADGAVLPRKTGVSNAPLKEAVPFHSPDSMRLTLTLPHHGEISGMGIRQGITLIVGGGYHGKSTLLKALEVGVYNHIAGDGREFVITDSTAVKLRAEEGRIVKSVDISPFINHLPNGKNTSCFSTEDASGSTSQAAGVMEGIEAGAKLFLIDEDTCATNFMVRDELMQQVIAPDKEPITPFLGRIRSLFSELGISTILVVGSSGAFFHAADRIIQMDSYRAVDITDAAKKAAAGFPVSCPEFNFSGGPAPRKLRFSLKRRDGDRSPKIKVQGRDTLVYDRETVDLRYVEQLADEEQTRALGYILQYLMAHPSDASMAGQLTALYRKLQTEGLESVTSSDCPPFMALPRLQEVFACVNRCRF